LTLGETRRLAINYQVAGSVANPVILPAKTHGEKQFKPIVPEGSLPTIAAVASVSAIATITAASSASTTTAAVTASTTAVTASAATTATAAFSLRPRFVHN
jgi:hypothetical protein